MPGAPVSFSRLDELADAVAALRRASPRLSGPCFAHLRISTKGKVRDLYLGKSTHVDAGVAIIDWKNAPLAEVFFSCDEGDDYEIEHEGRELAGTVLERHLLEIDDDGLRAVIASGFRYEQRGTGWIPTPFSHHRLAARPADKRTQAAFAAVALDPDQRAAVELPDGLHLLLLGEAGFGKTTVALHRLSRLIHEDPRRRALVIVPTQGLATLTRAVLERMEAGGVEIFAFEQWARREARHAFPRLPERESQDATAGVLRAKRDRALSDVLAAHAAASPKPITRKDLLRVFGDSALLADLQARSKHGISASTIAEVLEHTHIQFSKTGDEEFAHVDAENRITSDGRGLDDGTPMEDAGTIDAEDYAILFDLDRRRAGAHGKRPREVTRYDIVVVDEAQEFSALELGLLGRARHERGTLIVAGDAAQQVDPTTTFEGWPQAMADLGCADFHQATLRVNYRCPPDVTTLARHVIGLATVPHMPASVPVHTFANECHQAEWLIAAGRTLIAEDPQATVAILCRTAPLARTMAESLRRGLPLRLAEAGDFKFTGGVNVTCVDEVKGLEFDYVIIPDATADIYPDTALSRRALYVAMTRACHQLVLSSLGMKSPILP